MAQQDKSHKSHRSTPVSIIDREKEERRPKVKAQSISPDILANGNVVRGDMLDSMGDPGTVTGLLFGLQLIVASPSHLLSRKVHSSPLESSENDRDSRWVIGYPFNLGLDSVLHETIAAKHEENRSKIRSGAGIGRQQHSRRSPNHNHQIFIDSDRFVFCGCTGEQMCDRHVQSTGMGMASS